jgi:hypothetical protein
MRRVMVFDSFGGHSVGWNPDGVTTLSGITGETLGDLPVITVNLNDAFNSVCNVVDYTFPPDTPSKTFWVSCTNAPPEGADLLYVLEKLPQHFIGM